MRILQPDFIALMAAQAGGFTSCKLQSGVVCLMLGKALEKQQRAFYEMARISKEQVRQEKGTSTRREVLRRLCGAAVAMPLLPSFSALAITESDETDPVFGLSTGYQDAPEAPVESPSPPPAAQIPWQPPYRHEPPPPENSKILPILMYHRATVPAVFEAQLVGMLTAGYSPLSLHGALKGLLGEEQLPNLPIVLTFDDGWEIQYDAVFPVLKQYKVPATFFVMPGFHELQEGYMDWDKIIEISDFGMEVESHTINHADLPRLARTDWGAVLAEVVISKQLLEERLGKTLRYFDYPLGRQDEEIQQLVQDAGYEAAVIIGPGVHQSAETPYALRRIRVEAWEPWTSVEHQLNWYGAGPDQLIQEVPESVGEPEPAEGS